MGYRKYAKDYHPRLVPDKDGRGMKEIYVYKGPRFVVSLRPPLQKEKVKRRLLLYPAAALAALILAGLLENRGMRAFYVAVPYVVALLPAVLTLAGGWYAFRFKEPLKRAEADRAWRRLKWAPVFGMACTFITAVGGLVLMALAGFRLWELVYILLMLFCTLCYLAVWALSRNWKVEELPGEEQAGDSPEDGENNLGKK